MHLCVSIVIFLAVGLGSHPTVVQAQATENIAATVNGKQITQGDVDNTIFSQLFTLQQQIYAIRKVALENLISRALLEQEATRRGISFEEFKKQLIAQRVEVSASQVDELYAENAPAFAAMSLDEVMLRLRLDLESQARMKNYRETLAKLKEASQNSWLMDEPRLPVASEANAPSMGPPDALVTVVEFADFECPFCRNSQGVIRDILKNYKSQVRLVFRHRPLEIHSQAFTSAQAAFCAGLQGGFWQYHDALFISDDLSPKTLSNLASSIHLDLPKFEDCMKSEVSRATIHKEVDEAKRLGIDSTPTFVINGRVFAGVLSFEDFKAAIDKELKSRGKKQ
jgi:predicted DsbA family dithiol-disulfide isomerase